VVDRDEEELEREGRSILLNSEAAVLLEMSGTTMYSHGLTEPVREEDF
jgi:hypothetical protein